MIQDEEVKKPQAFQVTPVAQPFSQPVPTLGTGLSGMGRVISDLGVSPLPSASPGLDTSGTITAESAKAAVGNDMQRSGGVFGSIDMKGANEIMSRENKARGEMIDLSIAANGGNGIAVLNDPNEAANAEKTARWRQDDLIDKASRGNQGAVASAIQAGVQAQTDANRSAVAMRGQDIGLTSDIIRNGITARGQDLNAQSDANRNAVTMRGQDITAADTAARLGIQQADSARAADKWGIEKGILQGQAADSEAVRGARAELTAALASGDQTKIEAAKAKAVAAGIKFDKPNNEFVAVTDSMGMNITRTNKDTGAVDIIDGKTGALKATIPAPGQKPAQQAAPASAIEYLKKNPSQAAAFKAKYGYLPEGY